jgi:hypothetical protein
VNRANIPTVVEYGEGVTMFERSDTVRRTLCRGNNMLSVIRLFLLIVCRMNSHIVTAATH